MHKNIKVLKFELSQANTIKRIIEIYDMRHLPFSTDRDIKINHAAIKEWWTDRCIPVTRDDYANLKAALPDDDALSLMVKSRALSLDDQYWIKQEDETIDYDDVSFFSNRFSNDVGDVMVGIKNSADMNYYSPDSTSNGNLKKRWKIINGKTYLLKAGSKPFQYEIFNEIIASKVMEMLHIEHVDYEFVVDGGQIYCACPNFISYNEDLVTAYQLRNSRRQKNDASLYTHLLSVYESLNLPDYKKKLNQMLFVDYLLANVDRHLNNFGVIRDAKTLEFLRVAPIYDTGSCLGFDISDEQQRNLHDEDWKPFKSGKHKSQLDLIDDYSWLDLEALKSIPREADNILRSFQDHISERRRDTTLALIVKRINSVLAQLGNNDVIAYNPNPLTQLEKRIISFIELNGRELRDLQALAGFIGCAYITAYRAISDLTKKGVLVRVGSKKTGYWTLV